MSVEDDIVLTDKILVYLSVLCFVWYVFLWFVALLGCYSARKRYRVRPPSPAGVAAANSVPGVSILRPLKGLDTNLYENLESTFRQEYPVYEILFSVADENDQALTIVYSLLEKYPNINARVIIGEENVGVNPKVNNLIRSYTEAQYDILWVLDSNVTVVPGALARSVDALTAPQQSPSGRKIALVHHVPFAFVSESSLGSRVEAAFLNTNHAKMYIALNTLAVDSCVMGKSNLYRRSDVDRIDGSLKPHSLENAAETERGLKAFGRFMAEDNMIASALWHELDFRHDLSCDVALNAIGDMSLWDYFQRRVRWIRVRKYMVISATLLEPLTESVVIGVLASLSLHNLSGFPIFMFLGLHFMFWLMVDLDVYSSLAGHYPLSGSRLNFLVAWAIRELLAFPIWTFGVVGSEVVWRGKKYQMLRNGEVRPSQHSDRGMVKFLSLLGVQLGVMDDYEPLLSSQE